MLNTLYISCQLVFDSSWINFCVRELPAVTPFLSLEIVHDNWDWVELNLNFQEGWV